MTVREKTKPAKAPEECCRDFDNLVTKSAIFRASLVKFFLALPDLHRKRFALAIPTRLFLTGAEGFEQQNTSLARAVDVAAPFAHSLASHPQRAENEAL